MMKLNLLSLANTGRVLLLGVLLAIFTAPAVRAVELVGKPVPVGSASAQLVEEEASALEAESSPVEAASSLQAMPAAAANQEAAHPFAERRFPPLNEDTLIPLLAISMGIGGPVILIIFLVAMHYRAKDRRAKHINANIERLLAAGRDIPIELLRGDEVNEEAELLKGDINLHKGIKNLCIGLGLFVSLAMMFGIEFGGIGFIVMSVGLSQLCLWKLSVSKKPDAS